MDGMWLPVMLTFICRDFRKSSGTVCVGEIMLLGPDANGQFLEVKIDSIEVQRKAVQSLSAGETGAVLISFITLLEVCGEDRSIEALHR